MYGEQICVIGLYFFAGKLAKSIISLICGKDYYIAYICFSVTLGIRKVEGDALFLYSANIPSFRCPFWNDIG